MKKYVKINVYPDGRVTIYPTDYNNTFNLGQIYCGYTSDPVKREISNRFSFVNPCDVDDVTDQMCEMFVSELNQKICDLQKLRETFLKNI